MSLRDIQLRLHSRMIRHFTTYESNPFITTTIERNAMQSPPIKGVIDYLKENYGGKSSVKVTITMDHEEGLQGKVDIYHRKRFLGKHIGTVSFNRYDGKLTVSGNTVDAALLPQSKLDEIVQNSLSFPRA